MIRDNCDLLVSFCCLFLLASVGSIDLLFYTTFENNMTEKFVSAQPHHLIVLF